MTIRCVALLSGGLDSILAIRLMQEQQIEVEALNFKTIFTCCQNQSAQAARDLGVRLTVIGQEDDYLDLVRAPKFGYGKGANPCVDCRIYMFEKANRFMQQIKAHFVISGEVIGQRPMSQKRRDLDIISHHSDLDDLLLRPLSAKAMPPTKPEREGWVDRSRLHGIVGRSRKDLIRLAKKFGMQDIPTPSTGCALTEPLFSRKVHDLIQLDPTSSRWDFEILKVGRHFRFDDQTKVVVGRNEAENEQLSYIHRMPEAVSTAYFQTENFYGPSALLIGPVTEDSLQFVGGLILRYAGDTDQDPCKVCVTQRDRTYSMTVTSSSLAEQAQSLSTPAPAASAQKQMS